RIVNRRTHRGNLRGIALLRGRSVAVRVYLGGGSVASVGHAGAKAKLRQRILNNAPGGRRRAENLTLVIRRRDMGDLLHRLNHCLLEFRLGALGVIHQIEAVWNVTRFKRFAVTGRKGWAELGFVGIGGLVQVDVQQYWLVYRSDQLHERRRLPGLAVITK